MLQNDKKTVKAQREDFNVEVKPGYSELTVLEFPSKGNQAYSHHPSKLIIKFSQIANDQYKRKGNDLTYTHKITLEQAILSEPVQIVHTPIVYLLILKFRLHLMGGA